MFPSHAAGDEGSPSSFFLPLLTPWFDRAGQARSIGGQAGWPLPLLSKPSIPRGPSDSFSHVTILFYVLPGTPQAFRRIAATRIDVSASGII